MLPWILLLLNIFLICTHAITHSFPMHPFSTPWKNLWKWPRRFFKKVTGSWKSGLYDLLKYEIFLDKFEKSSGAFSYQLIVHFLKLKPSYGWMRVSTNWHKREENAYLTSITAKTILSKWKWLWRNIKLKLMKKALYSSSMPHPY